MRAAVPAGYSPGAAIAAQLDAGALHNRHPLDRARYVWIKTMLEGQILTRGWRPGGHGPMPWRPARLFLDHHLAEYAARLLPGMRIHGRTEKYVLREAMKGLLPETLYMRGKFAFMAPPARTEPDKWSALQVLIGLHEASDTSAATQTQLDAVIYHLIGVQVLHEHFVASDIPTTARCKATELGWTA